MHTVNPLPLDATNDNATSASFFAGFTRYRSNINSNAKATISNFVTDAVPTVRLLTTAEDSDAID